MLAYEPGLSISYSSACTPIEDSDQPAWTRGLRWPPEVALDPWLITECRAKDSDQTARMQYRKNAVHLIHILIQVFALTKTHGQRLAHNVCES